MYSRRGFIGSALAGAAAAALPLKGAKAPGVSKAVYYETGPWSVWREGDIMLIHVKNGVTRVLRNGVVISQHNSTDLQPW